MSLQHNFLSFLKEFDRRKISWEMISPPFYVRADYNGHTEYLMEMCNRLLPAHLHFMLNDKFVAKVMTQQKGFSVAQGTVFEANQFDDAHAFALELGFPVVIKARDLSKGIYVCPGIQNSTEFSDVWHKVMQRPHPYCLDMPKSILVERHYTQWIDYRFMFVEGMDPVVIKRLPPYVTGDGTHSIQQLIQRHNARIAEQSRTCTAEIYLSDSDGMRCLAYLGLDLSVVLDPGQRIPLRYNANESYGGSAEIVTGNIHASYMDLAKSVFDSFEGLRYCGIDLLIENALQPCDADNYVVLEYATYPGYSLFSNPTYGDPQDIIPFIVDLLFPETKNR